MANSFDSAVFQAGGLVVVLVEVMRRNFLASMVPVIVNAILNGHQIVVDIVAFVSRGDFPRSRLGEKQRGKILGSWVTRKMRTIAQFGIKDAYGEPNNDSSASRRSGTSFRTNSVRGGSSLKHVESSSALADLEERDYAPLPEGVAEMPAMDDNSIMDSPPHLNVPTEPYHGQGDDTPTAMSRGDADDMSSDMAADIYGTDRPHNIAELDEETARDHGHHYGNVPYLSLPDVDAGGSLMGESSNGGGGLRVANHTEWDREPGWPLNQHQHDYGKFARGNAH